jgi:E3 ubiquitin-protein ligase BRE1
MEDKKRTGDPLDGRASKRVSIDEEARGPLTQEDVIQFQKEAIFRQMQVYKRERDLVQDKLDGLQKDYQQATKCFHALNNWFDQVIDVLGGTEPLNGKHNLVNGESLVQNLLFTAVVEGESEFSIALSKKEGSIRSRLTKVTSADPQIAQLQEALSGLSTKFHHSQSQCEDLRLSNDKLRSEVSKVTERYLAAAKRIERIESPTLNRIRNSERAVDISETSSVEPEMKDTKGSDPAGDSGAVTAVAAVAAASEELTKELETARSALSEAQAVAAKQKEQLEEQASSVSALTDQIRDFKLRMLNLTDADLQNSDAFRTLAQRNSDLMLEVSHLRTQRDQFLSEKSELIAGREEFESRLKEEYDQKKEEVDGKLTKADQDVTRIRAARDDLLSELNIKKAGESEKTNSTSQLKELVGIRDSRISQLEDQIANYRQESTSTSDIGANLDGAGLEDLKALVAKLQRQNKNLSAEIPGLEQAFAKANAKATAKVFDSVERDAKVNKLTVEKVKADEKYFSAMRSKDQLGLEISRLKSQLTKSAELIQQLREGENSKSMKITRLEKEKQSVDRKFDNGQSELQSAKGRLAEQNRRLDSANRVIERLNQDLRNKDQQAREEVNSRRNLEVEVEKLKTQVKTTRIGTGSQSEMEEQLESLRSIALCSVCSKNWKDTALKVCGHVFCNDCAKDRLNSRLRKCPACNKQYSFSDLLAVHL